MRCVRRLPRAFGGSADQHDLDNLGGHSGGDTPLPIPNREVKPASADGTRGASPRESRTPPSLSAVRKPASAGFRSHVDRPLKASAVAAAERSQRSAVRRLARMELRDGDLVLRPWTEDDVDAMVAGCNDPDVARWIPTIPSSVHATRMRSRSSAARSRPTIRRLAIDARRRGRRRHRDRASTHTTTAATIGYWVAARARGQGDLHARAAAALTLRARRARASARSTSSPIPTTSRRSASPRRSGSSARASCARTCDTRTGAFATR